MAESLLHRQGGARARQARRAFVLQLLLRPLLRPLEAKAAGAAGT